ncbi:MAG: hypothetical protein E7Z80_05635 [Methanobrevibacter thaueri]|nr:hypothetical protein [Methanobrevibacter thaueri]
MVWNKGSLVNNSISILLKDYILSYGITQEYNSFIVISIDLFNTTKTFTLVETIENVTNVPNNSTPVSNNIEPSRDNSNTNLNFIDCKIKIPDINSTLGKQEFIDMENNFNRFSSVLNIDNLVKDTYLSFNASSYDKNENSLYLNKSGDTPKIQNNEILLNDPYGLASYNTFNHAY